jgi:hypothetical protein
MTHIERTSVGFQMVIPGCETRTLPKSASYSDQTGQGLFQFFRPPRSDMPYGGTAALTGAAFFYVHSVPETCGAIRHAG